MTNKEKLYLAKQAKEIDPNTLLAGGAGLGAAALGTYAGATPGGVLGGLAGGAAGGLYGAFRKKKEDESRLAAIAKSMGIGTGVGAGAGLVAGGLGGAALAGVPTFLTADELLTKA